MSRKHKSRHAVPRHARETEQRLSALAALSLAWREGISLSLAAKAEGVRPSTVRKWTPGAWRKHGRDYRAKPNDRIIRILKVPNRKGMQPVITYSRRAASKVSRYHNAIKEALRGKPSALKPFRGKRIPGSKNKYLTNLVQLRRLHDAGLLDFKDIYWRGRIR